MNFISTALPYEQVTYFSKIVTDYIKEAASLKPFYVHPVSLHGIKDAIESRKRFNTNRAVLTTELQKQYSLLENHGNVEENINLLNKDNTFTVTTAHQPNIFTGHLYFIYKILHTIKLAEFLAGQMPEYHFVPVFYMGSEDADLEELGNIHLNGEKLVWKTNQRGAVGRMNTNGLEKIIERLDGELSVLPHGHALIQLLKLCYLESPDVQTATFKLAHHLFAGYGLVVLLPDNPSLKGLMRPVFQDDLLTQKASSIIGQTIERLSGNYKVQASPREINLFYLKDDIRERIIRDGDEWKVIGTQIRFTEEQLNAELEQHPERFSPNVILRGLYQEIILPNIAFIGGSGEIAYWLEFKDLFAHYQVPLPVLILRNSFLFVDKNTGVKIKKLELNVEDIFKEEQLLIEDIVKQHSGQQLELNDEIASLSDYYKNIKVIASKVDASLDRHVAAIGVQSIKKIRQLEKKMLKAEKRKFESQQRQINSIRKRLFPNNGLQERVENFSPFYAKYGPAFFDAVYDRSLTLEQEFVIIQEV